MPGILILITNVINCFSFQKISTTSLFHQVEVLVLANQCFEVFAHHPSPFNNITVISMFHEPNSSYELLREIPNEQNN